MGKRWMAGTFFSGNPRVTSLESKVEESFTTVTAKVGAKQVDKLAKSALNNYINDMVYDILNDALDKPTGLIEKEEEIEEKDMYLQLSSQILVYRLLLRQAPVPNLLQRAATKTDFRSGPLEDLRRLGKLFSEEYSSDLDKLVEEDKERVKGLKEDLLEEAQRELIRDKTNISSLFGVNTSVNTSYASPRPVKLKEPKEKKKSLFAKKEPSAGIVLNPNIVAGPSSDFMMPTGSNLDINKGYLNKIKKQLERREEKASMRQLSTSLPLTSTLPTTLPTNLPTTLPNTLPT